MPFRQDVRIHTYISVVSKAGGRADEKRIAIVNDFDPVSSAGYHFAVDHLSCRGCIVSVAEVAEE